MILVGDVLERLRELERESVNCCVTSPPYWGLRDYGVEGQIGLEETVEEHVENMVAVFREVMRVIRPDGTLWMNYGDAYMGSGPNRQTGLSDERAQQTGAGRDTRKPVSGLKPKDLVGMPWRIAFALQADGWYLRSDVIWAKPNPMPESVTDRPTKSHEYLFLLTKSADYWYDADAIAEQAKYAGSTGYMAGAKNGARAVGRKRSGNEADGAGRIAVGDTRNARTVWTIPTRAYPEAHFATFPEEIPRRCIRAGCPPGGTVLDPFAGSGTTVAVAIQEGREGIGIELNPEYAELARQRIRRAETGIRESEQRDGQLSILEQCEGS